jgi:hypothetical protein
MNPHYYRSEHNPARDWHVDAERELRARVFELEREVARLRGELQVVRATCLHAKREMSRV